MYKINFIVLFGFCLGFSSTLYGVQENDISENDSPNSDSNLTSSSYASEEKSSISSSSSEKPNDIWCCKSIKQCRAFLCIVDCLKCWQELNDVGKLKNIFGYLSSSNNYMNIIDAYHHLLNKHLCAKDNKDEYKYINQKIRQEIDCNFKTCQGYTRNQRKREKEEDNKIGDNDVFLWKCSSCGLKNYIEQQHCHACFKRDDMCSNHPMKSNMDKEYIFLRDFLDTIHAYLLHGVDSGHRYIKDGNVDDIKDKDDSDDIGDLFDHEMQALKEWQNRIKKQQRNQNKNDKFQTKINEIKKELEDKKISLDTLKEKFGDDKAFETCMIFLLQNECDTDNILQQIDDKEYDTSIIYDNFTLDKKDKIMLFNRIKEYIQQQKDDKKNEKAGYGFGVRLYYWDYYKNRDVDWWVDYDTREDKYVASTYLSFKNEILAKDIPVSKWNQKYYEAKMLLNKSETLKKIYAEEPKFYNIVTEYGFTYGDKIRIEHILSIIFYTNFTLLCTEFSKSFRYLSTTESLQDVIKRNSKWYFLSKYVREVVEVFGKKICDKEVRDDVYYHGVNYLLFSEFCIKFCSPLSTSKQLEVATLFTNDDGLIVELKRYAFSLRFFNVCLISCFSSEDERLFIGGYLPMQISTIRLLKDNINIQQIMHALFVFRCMIEGKRLVYPDKATSLDISIFDSLLSSSSSLPLYAKQIWNVFKNKQQTVHIEMLCMYGYYSLFLPHFISSNPKFKNLFLFDRIVKILPNITEIECFGVDYVGQDAKEYKPDEYSGCSSSVISLSYILGLKDVLYKIEQNKCNKLKKIIIETGENEIGINLDSYVEQFGLLGWDIKKENESYIKGWWDKKRYYKGTISLTKK